MPRFVIVIPTHESLKTLPAAVSSALNQTYKDYSIVISDNASNDGTNDYLAAIADRRVCAAVSHAERVNKSQNWNRAFTLAPDCEYLVMLHSDDVLYADCLAALSQGIARFGARALFYGNHDRMSIDNRVHIKRAWPYAYSLDRRRAALLLSLKNAASVVAFTMKRDAFVQSGGFNGALEFLQDQDMAVRLAAIGGAVYLPAKMGCYRDSPVRPRVVERWAREELDFLMQEISFHKIHPAFAGICLRGRLSFLEQRLSRESPDFLPEFFKLQAEITSRKVGKFDRTALLLVMQLLKTWYSLCRRNLK